VEHPVPGVPVPLGRQQAGRPGLRHAPADQEHVGFLAGLQDAQLRIDRGQLGDQPVRVGLGTAFQGFGLVPGRPAVALGHPVGDVEVVQGRQRQTLPLPLFKKGFFVEALLAAPFTGAAAPMVVRVRRIAHGSSSSGR
jgi:hypothetical protein